jgi:NAD-dependent DNA ligase
MEPVKKPILLPTKKPILLPAKKPILLPTKKPLLPIPVPKSPTKTLNPVPKSPNKILIPIPKSPIKRTREFSINEIDEDTVIDFALSLSNDDFRDLLSFLSDYYYNDEALITDKKFNELEAIYKELYGEYEAEWPKARGETVLLPYHLSSLNKMVEEREINNWINKHPGPYLLQDKIDGITLLLVSEMVNNRRKISLFTHGDGVEGKDISYALDYINLPKIDYDIAIRGEGVYNLDIFNELFKDRYRNPRNMITGSLVSKKSFDPEVVKHLSFYTYQIRSERNTPLDDIIKLQKLGFDVPVYELVDDISPDYLENYYLDRKEKAKTEIDGTVVYQNVIIDYPEIKGKLPSQVIAFKTDTGAEIGETTVTRITWNASKHRKLKPVVHYDKVVFTASDLKQATGHNARYIKENNIGPGAIIRVKRSKDVIPKIIDVIEPAPNGADLPDPDIYGEYEWNATGAEIVLLHDNDQVRTNKLRHFIVTLKVKKAGPERVKSMVESGIKTIKDLLNATPEDLAKLPGIGMNLATQILDDITDKITNVPLAKILDASDIFPGIGERRFDEILLVHPDLLNYAYDSPLKIIEMIKEIRGFGPKLSEIIGYNLATFVNWLYDNPKITIEKPKIISNDRNNSLAGETIVFSGFRDPDLERKVKLEGGKVTSAVSKNTTILVLKDLDPETFKGKGQKALELNEKAREQGKEDVVRIMSKDDFLNEYF